MGKLPIKKARGEKPAQKTEKLTCPEKKHKFFENYRGRATARGIRKIVGTLGYVDLYYLFRDYEKLANSMHNRVLRKAAWEEIILRTKNVFSRWGVNITPLCNFVPGKKGEISSEDEKRIKRFVHALPNRKLKAVLDNYGTTRKESPLQYLIGGATFIERLDRIKAKKWRYE